MQPSNVRESSTSTGVGDFVLAGAPVENSASKPIFKTFLLELRCPSGDCEVVIQ